jgi:hypothetical protein
MGSLMKRVTSHGAAVLMSALALAAVAGCGDGSSSGGGGDRVTSGQVTVDAGPSIGAAAHFNTALKGSASTTGTGTVTVTCSEVSGPGTVTFSNANGLDTYAIFSAPGDYVVCLTATDGTNTASSTVAVTALLMPGGPGGGCVLGRC